jgi:sterol desaturase/sphingolipid hydroxylase (fatty acid hydroxylase superfamily)
VTNYRFHFVDETLLRLWLFIPFQILGAGVEMWLVVHFIGNWILLLQHSEWDWTYGRLGRIFVSPAFHRIHHSKDQRLHDRNYAMLFSFWDDLFGTAERKAPPPTEHGLAGNPVPETILGQIAYPFVAIARELRRPAPGVAPVAPPTHTAAE